MQSPPPTLQQPRSNHPSCRIQEAHDLDTTILHHALKPSNAPSSLRCATTVPQWLGPPQAIIGDGVVTGLSGCSGLSQRDHEVSTSVWAVGIPGVAIIKQSAISPDNRSEKDNTAIQSNPVSVSPRLK